LLFIAAAAAQEAAPAQPMDSVTNASIDLRHCTPLYPRESLVAEETGVTRLRMHIAASGELRGISLIKSSGFSRLDRATIDALGRCKFRAAMREGAPIDSSFIVEYKWQLDGPTPPLAGGCKPEYPAEALRAGEQGLTRLRFQLTEAGEAENIDIVRSSGSGRLDEASIAHVRRCRFKQPKRPSAATPAPTFTVGYNWRIEDGVPVAPLGPVTPDPYRPPL
jgi:TonB family protein